MMHFGPWVPFFLRLLLAAGLGGVVGLERELRHKPAGLRTSMFICMGAALFTALSGEVARVFGDTSGTRIVSNLIPGIGFLGAGAILRERGSVVGLTTAATIFMLAAVGMAAGAGFAPLAIAATILMLVILVPLGWFEEWFSLKRRLLTFRLTTPDVGGTLTHVHEVMADLGLAMQHFQVFPAGAQSVLEFDTEVSHAQQKKLAALLAQSGWKCEVAPALLHE